MDQLQNPAHLGLRARLQAHLDELDAQRVRQKNDVFARTASIMQAIPQFTATLPSPQHTTWIKYVVLGTLISMVEQRDEAVEHAMHEILPACMAELTTLMQSPVETAQTIRAVVAKLKAGVANAEVMRLEGIETAGIKVADYIQSYPGMAFVPGGRQALLARMSCDLLELARNPMPKTLEAEQSLGLAELALADEMDALPKPPVV